MTHKLQVLDPNLDTTGLLALLASGINLSFTSLVEGNYNIAGRYCEPEVHNPLRHNTLQLLAHPATYDRNYVSSIRFRSKSNSCLERNTNDSLVVRRRLSRLRLQWQ